MPEEWDRDDPPCSPQLVQLRRPVGRTAPERRDEPHRDATGTAVVDVQRACRTLDLSRTAGCRHGMALLLGPHPCRYRVAAALQGGAEEVHLRTQILTSGNERVELSALGRPIERQATASSRWTGDGADSEDQRCWAA